MQDNERPSIRDELDMMRIQIEEILTAISDLQDDIETLKIEINGE
jgi:peptidoglycan hydrolase CwlO-like protein